MTQKNFTLSIENSATMIESLLMKKNSKYDIFFYDNSYIYRYYPYLLDLSIDIPEDHINMYDMDIFSQVCMYQDKVVGFVRLQLFIIIIIIIIIIISKGLFRNNTKKKKFFFFFFFFDIIFRNF